MQRLALDFMPHAASGRWFGIGMLIVAVLVGAKQADVYASARQEVAQLRARLLRLESHGERPRQTALPEATVREIRRANDVIEQISLPWDRLFRAVESAAVEKVGLLGITPDPKSGTVEVAGEAADLNAMFDYVKRLQRQRTLTRVFLLNQKLDEQNPQHPIRFTVSASWMEKKPAS